MGPVEAFSYPAGLRSLIARGLIARDACDLIHSRPLRMHPSSSHPRGFTLVELVYGLTIVAVLFGIGVPSAVDLHSRVSQQTTYHALTASLMQARSVAITRGTRVAVCPSSDGLKCREDSVWSDGWIVFVDANNLQQPISSNAIIRRFDALPGGVTATSSAGRRHVRYLEDGRAAGSNLRITICDHDQRLVGRVVVNNAGRARTERMKAERACSNS